MSIEIRSIRGDLIFAHEGPRFQDAVEAAIRQGVSLAGARLCDGRYEDVDFTGGDFTGADFSCACFYGDCVLKGVNLTRAWLQFADFSRARTLDLSGAILAPGLTWDHFVAEVVPRLLTAGGRTLDEVLATGCWKCHSWENCPLHEAFGVNGIIQIPSEHQSDACRFLHLFDAGLLREPAHAV